MFSSFKFTLSCLSKRLNWLWMTFSLLQADIADKAFSQASLPLSTEAWSDLIERSDKFNQKSICKLHFIHMWSKLILVFCQNICVSHTNLTWYFSNWNTVKRRGNSSFFTLTPPLTYINLLLLSRPNRKSGYLLCPIKKLQINKLLLI